VPVRTGSGPNSSSASSSAFAGSLGMAQHSPLGQPVSLATVVRR
jgi:hypothetical protein